MNTTVLFIVYIVSYILAGTILSIMISYVWINRKLLFPNLSVVLLASAWIWLIMQLCEYLVADMQLKFLFNKLQYIGIALLPISWIGFANYYINDDMSKTLRAIALSSIGCAFFLVLVFTNDSHHLLWTDAHINSNTINVKKNFSPVYFFFLGYIMILFAGGFIYFFTRLIHKEQYRQKQATTILIGVIVPFVVMIAMQFLPDAYSYLDMTPICVSVSSLLVVYFIRLKYYRTIPLAQHIVTESMNDLLFILNLEKQIIYINPAAYGIINGANERIIGRYIHEVLPQLDAVIKKASTTGVRNEQIAMNAVYYDLCISPIQNRDAKPIGTVLVARDITRLKTVEENLMQMKEELEARVDERTRELASINDMLKAEIFERMKTEEKLNVSLAEKDILLGEIHHRVKNNLQVIMSLLKLQKNQISDSKALQNFNTAISRIQSIAMIHERLYKSKDLANTEFSDYINHLTHEIVYLHSDYGSAIYLAINAQNIFLDIDRSILCGLILNELILNVIKYAFPQDVSNTTGRMNKLGIDFYEEDESYVLRTTDNGVGLPPDFNMNDSDTLGMKIINTLVKQLSGTISLSVKEGTEVTIRFPKKKGS